jgi:hypothetical protein
MRRTLLCGVLFVLALGGTQAPALAADKIPLAAKLSACTTGADPAARAATFTASMPAIDGTKRMAMRFDLLQRRGEAGPFVVIDVPNWGVWDKSEPGRPGFIFTKRVEALLAPAAYRAVVTFRWLDRKGRMQRTRTRTAGICEQPDQRPDLVLASFAAQPKGQDAVYDVGVRNGGGSAAGSFTVVVTIDGKPQPPVAFGPLAPGEAANGQLVGPRCTPRSIVTIRVDAGGAVDESHEDDNVVQQACPLA